MGLRRPVHQFAVASGLRQLLPFFAAPMRPNEALLGFSLRGQEMLNLYLKSAFYSPVVLEAAVWAVPLGALGPEFVEWFSSGDPEDVRHLTDPESGPAADGWLSPTHTDHGPTSGTPLSWRNVQYAGEIAVAETETPGAGEEQSYYARYVSAALHAIGKTWYELDKSEPAPQAGPGDLEPAGAEFVVRDDDRSGFPPIVGKRVRGMLQSAIPYGGVGTDSPDDPAGGVITDSFADFAERMTQMARADRTYMELLGEFGVSPNRVECVPRLLSVDRSLLHPIGRHPNRWTGHSEPVATDSYTAGRNQYGSAVIAPEVFNETVGNQVCFIEDDSPMAEYGARLNLSRRKIWVASEPTIIIGTWVWWPDECNDVDGAHVLDITRLNKPSLWGAPAHRLAETQFITAQEIRSQGGVALHTDEHSSTPSYWAMNALNLFLNGDTFSNSPDLMGLWPPFGSPASDPGGQTRLINADLRCTMAGEARLAISTDLVK